MFEVGPGLCKDPKHSKQIGMERMTAMISPACQIGLILKTRPQGRFSKRGTTRPKAKTLGQLFCVRIRSQLKNTFSARLHEHLTRELETLVFLSSELNDPFSKIHLEQFPVSAGAQFRQITARTFRSNPGQNAITIPEWIEKYYFFDPMPDRNRVSSLFDRKRAIKILK